MDGSISFVIFISLKTIYVSLTVSLVFAKYPQNSFGLYFLFFYAMISSVRQSLRCRAIYASDLLILRKKSMVVPVHQNSSLVLSALKKPADQPLHVSTSVENLKFKCEAAAMSTVMKRKNITGAYLATRWAVPNVAVLNALALTPYSTLSIMTLNPSPGKAGYASGPSIRRFLSFWHPTTEVVNESDKDIQLSIEQHEGKSSFSKNLKARGREKIEKDLFENKWRTVVIIKVGSLEGGIAPENFIWCKKLVFNIDTNGKLVGKRMFDEYHSEELDIYQVP